MTFQAKYDGICGECKEPIYKGDQLVWDDDHGNAVHSECVPDDAKEKPLRATCPKCWQILSVTGACGCDPE